MFLKKSFLLLASVLGLSSAASATTCLCEIDTTIKAEMKYYRMGCNSWLNRLIKQNKCDTWDVREIGDRYAPLNLPHMAGNKLILGYVGHWSSSDQTKNHIDYVLLPAMKSKGISIEYDNTACLATSDSEDLQSYLLKHVKPQLRKNQYMAMKGNQGISIGLWDDVFGPTANFYSYVDTRRTKPVYPTCAEFENKKCLGPKNFLGKLLGSAQVQVGTTGSCKNQQDQLVQLICDEVSNGKYVWVKM
ncbi:hypothetical protein [Bdellovibrio sp. HCB-162]|uniref:hypothetical protein n=1 Tax=Bdellovibrio sp. HCB-162 TaxID=3394234 RepID=UPI0039BC678C